MGIPGEDKNPGMGGFGENQRGSFVHGTEMRIFSCCPKFWIFKVFVFLSYLIFHQEFLFAWRNFVILWKLGRNWLDFDAIFSKNSSLDAVISFFSANGRVWGRNCLVFDGVSSKNFCLDSAISLFR